MIDAGSEKGGCLGEEGGGEEEEGLAEHGELYLMVITWGIFFSFSFLKFNFLATPASAASASFIDSKAPWRLNPPMTKVVPSNTSPVMCFPVTRVACQNIPYLAIPPRRRSC